MSEQLRLDGTEAPVELTPASQGLTEVQRGILHRIGEHGYISSTQAGVIVHIARGWCGFGSKNGPNAGEACCGYACADGLAACNRLAKRGLVRRGDKLGRWVRP